MSLIPEELTYTKNHIWLTEKDDFTGVCGITDYAQEMLRDIVYVESIDEDFEVSIDEKILQIESITQYFDIISPATGKIVVNESLYDSPEIINADPYGEGWIFEIDIRFKIELEDHMDADAYSKYIESL